MPTPAIAVRGLTRIFDGLTAVGGVEFEVARGAFLFERSESVA